MRQLLKQIPLPISGLMLGLFSLARLALMMEQPVLEGIFFALGVTLWILIVMKIIFAFKSVKEQLKNPIDASVFPTFTMGTMVLSSILMTYNMNFKYLWIIAFIMQIMLICYFVITFMVKSSVSLQSVYPSWFILFVGLGIAPVTLGNTYTSISKIVFIIVLLCYVLLLPFVLLRVFKHKLPNPAKPLLVILSAPASLLFVGYMQTYDTVNTYLMLILFVLSQVFYLIIIGVMPRLLKLSFYPSYAAFTFPLVISATAVEKMFLYTNNPFIEAVATLEFAVAVCVVMYVYVRYMMFLSTSISQNKVTS